MSTRHLILLLALPVFLASGLRADILSGQVVDPNGFGIAGVKLDVQNLAGADPVVMNGTTDALGQFEATVPAGFYRVIFEPPEPPLSTFLPGEIESLLVTGTTSVGVITLQLGVSLSGRLVNTSFVPVANVDLDVRDETTGLELLLLNDNTDPLGTFTVVVPAGPIAFQIDPSTVLPGTGVLAPQELSMTPLFNLNLGDIVLQPGLTVTGVLLDAFGLPVVDADFDFELSSTGVDIYTPGDNTDAFGVFSFVTPPGVFDIQICPAPGVPLVAREFKNVPVNNNVNAGLVSLQSGVFLSGTVVDCQGAPAQDADIDVRNAASGASVPLCHDNTDHFGSYSVVVPTGTFDIIVVSFLLGTGTLLNDVNVFGNTIANANLPCCPAGNVVVRNGSGINPLALQALNNPTIGGTLNLQVDASGHAPSALLVVAMHGSIQGFFTAAGELLINPNAPLGFTLAANHIGGITALNGNVPLNPALCGKTIHAQAIILGSPGPQYTNALALTVGG